MFTDNPIPYSSEEPLSTSQRVFLALQEGNLDAFYAALEELPVEEQAKVRNYFSFSPADGVTVVY